MSPTNRAGSPHINMRLKSWGILNLAKWAFCVLFNPSRHPLSGWVIGSDSIEHCGDSNNPHGQRDICLSRRLTCDLKWGAKGDSHSKYVKPVLTDTSRNMPYCWSRGWYENTLTRFVARASGTILVLRTGEITKWRMKCWKDTEQYPHWQYKIQ